MENAQKSGWMGSITLYHSSALLFFCLVVVVASTSEFLLSVFCCCACVAAKRTKIAPARETAASAIRQEHP
ncbi:unnamed protein product [Caretta caretta]